MKKFFICAMSVLTITSSYCQQTGPGLSPVKQDYLEKSKNQKTAAWVLLGGGAAVVVGAAILDVSSDWDKPETPYLVAIGVGGASMIASIPLFIASGRNKRKALNASAYFKMRKTRVPANTGYTLVSTPTLSLELDF